MQPENSQEVVRKISEQVQDILHQWYGASAILDSHQPLIKRMRYSFILRYYVNHQDHNIPSIIVKINRSPDIISIEQAISSTGNNTNSEQEYLLMKSIENTIKKADKPRLDAIKMLGFLPEWNAIVMEKFSGEILREHFLRRVKFFGFEENRVFIEKALYHSGDWLRIFHNQFGNRKILPFFVDEWLEDVYANFDYLRPRVDKVGEIDSLIQKFKQVSNKLVGYPVQYATLHGDFHMKNILVKDDGSIACFDPHPNCCGPIYRDLARMAIDPTSIKFQVLSQGLLINKNSSTSFLSSVIKGYFNGDKFDPKLFNLFIASEYLRKWRDDEYRLRQLKGNNLFFCRVLSSYVSNYFLRIIRRELSQLDTII